MIIFKKILLCIGLLFVTVFLSVGYAALSKEFNVGGTIKPAPPSYEIYISSVEAVSMNNCSETSTEIVKPTSLRTSVNVTRANASITYIVTIKNDSNVNYWYDRYKVLENQGVNNLVGTNNGITITTKDLSNDSTNTFNSDDWVIAKTARTFYVTYTFGSNAVGSNISNLINFHFEIRVDSVYEDFTDLLNNPTTYQILSNAFNDAYKESGTTVLANIGEDTELFDQLFGPNLKYAVDGEEKPVTVLIQRKNIDNKSTGDSYTNGGPSGCEYTIYITTDDLSDPNGKASVYAVTYSCGADGEWYQLGELYAGKTNKEDYDSSTSTYEGSVNVDSWIADSATYYITDGLSYKVNTNAETADKAATLTEITTVQHDSFFNNVDNSRIFYKAYDIIKANPSSNAPEVVNLVNAFNAASRFMDIRHEGREIKVVRNCTRSEIIPYLEAIQKAIDYYNQIRGK